MHPASVRLYTYKHYTCVCQMYITHICVCVCLCIAMQIVDSQRITCFIQSCLAAALRTAWWGLLDFSAMSVMHILNSQGIMLALCSAENANTISDKNQPLKLCLWRTHDSNNIVLRNLNSKRRDALSASKLNRSGRDSMWVKNTGPSLWRPQLVFAVKVSVLRVTLLDN